MPRCSCNRCTRNWLNVTKAYYISDRYPEIFNFDSIRPSVTVYHERQNEANAIIEVIASHPGVTLVRPERRMFDEHGRGKIMASGELLCRDDNHLSTAGALYVAPVFDEVFRQRRQIKRLYMLYLL